ncbi:transposase [Rickettsia bellii]|uniref:Putative permease n=2 Tax=Rickettsia bellii TaxID=33990 RepID=A0A0F3QGH5_RICBE|nr:Rpn family recombination-promoting nuclease/putative transposase [Rickettsia bellii]ARD86892.1 transposase [Rickettsia bellii]KJV91633.1 putative permease [Rickettsia bellii str. RML Mogi]
MVKKLKHDSLVKIIMTDKIAAQEFLEYYLPEDFKKLIDLSKITVEQESYIEESLSKKYSDIVYGIETKEYGKGFVYILIEAQSTVDYWTALRLWKYTLLLCERHKEKRNKLPLVYNLVIYNGKQVYNAPRNLWDLFTNSVMAKKLMMEDYQLVDLQAMSDNEIVKKKHIGMLEYILKHIHERDMIQLWEQFLANFNHVIMLDKEKGYIYLKSFLWYTDAKISKKQQPRLVQVFDKYLSPQHKDNIMKTIADVYIDEGKQEGKREGEYNKAVMIAKKMFSQGFKIPVIAELTGLKETLIRSIIESS